MGIMHLGKMTLSSIFKKPETRKYPYEVREPFARTRGQIDMTDIHDCIYCGRCQKQCPADCIEVDRKAASWKYAPYKCIACDSCVRACPKDVLFMVQNRPSITTDPHSAVEYALTAEEIAERDRIAAEKKAKALAAKKAKEEREAAKKAAQESDGAGE